MARRVIPTELVADLRDPALGLPMLRAGLGGLASALRALAPEAARIDGHWTHQRLPHGETLVDEHRVQLRWESGKHKEFFGSLFESVFTLCPEHGVIQLAGTFDPEAPPDLSTQVSVQSAMRRTFLQFGPHAKRSKAGPRTVTVTIDDEERPLKVDSYLDFAHRKEGAQILLDALKEGRVGVAGYVFPGAVQRHAYLPNTKYDYSPEQALAALFSAVGTISFALPNRGGALLIPEPTNLTGFAEIRPRLAPRNFRDARLAGLGDVALRTELLLKTDEVAKRHAQSIARVHAIRMKTLPWNSQQKARCETLSMNDIDGDQLDLYEQMREELPSRIYVRKDESDVFDRPSALRGFVSDNLARARPWFQGFATAKDGEGRFLHFYAAEGNLGALRSNERKGLIVLTQHLAESQEALVVSVHEAMRHRFGAIASENAGNAPAMNNRFSRERDRWRMRFAGAKTLQQLRGVFADLWSRGGSNDVLQEHWRSILPLLDDDQWQLARDLALVAIASYRGRSSAEQEASNTETNDTEQEQGE
ncbi:MAG: type I-MYXAN CRISPR-associated Cas8a1/Cmx1 [Myxococcota bacterium]